MTDRADCCEYASTVLELKDSCEYASTVPKATYNGEEQLNSLPCKLSGAQPNAPGAVLQSGLEHGLSQCTMQCTDLVESRPRSHTAPLLRDAHWPLCDAPRLSASHLWCLSFTESTSNRTCENQPTNFSAPNFSDHERHNISFFLKIFLQEKDQDSIRRLGDFFWATSFRSSLYGFDRTWVLVLAFSADF